MLTTTCSSCAIRSLSAKRPMPRILQMGPAELIDKHRYHDRFSFDHRFPPNSNSLILTNNWAIAIHFLPLTGRPFPESNIPMPSLGYCSPGCCEIHFRTHSFLLLRVQGIARQLSAHDKEFAWTCDRERDWHLSLDWEHSTKVAQTEMKSHIDINCLLSKVVTVWHLKSTRLIVSVIELTAMQTIEEHHKGK
jgi:hypothetical protein